MNWILTVELSDLWQDKATPIWERAPKIVERIEKSGWLDLTPYPDTFRDLLAELKKQVTVDGFDFLFADVYDLADSDGVWIETRGKVVKL